MRDMLFLLALPILLPLAMLRSQIAVMCWAWATFVMPNNFIYGFLSSFEFTKLFAGATLVSFFMSGEKKRLRLDAIIVLFILLSVLSVLSTNSAITTVIDSSLYRDRLLKGFAYCLVITMVATNRVRLHTLLMAIVLGVSFHGSLEFVKYAGSGGTHAINGPNMDNNGLALYMLMILGPLHHLRLYSANRLVRLGIVGVMLACVGTVIVSFSRGGFMGLLAMLGWVTVRSPSRWSILAKVIPAVVLATLFVPEAWYSRVETIGEANSDNSFMQRVVAWKISTLIAIDNPFLGGGPRAVQDQMVWTRYSRDLSRLDFVSTPEPSETSFAAHSIYFEILGDYGFTGITIFITILVLAWRRTSAIRARCRGRPEWEWADHLAFMMQLTLISYIVAGAALAMTYFELFWILVTIIVALDGITREVKPATVAAVRRPNNDGHKPLHYGNLP